MRRARRRAATVERFALEARDATLEHLRAAVAALDALPHRPQEAMDMLAGWCVEHRLAV